MAKKVDYNQKEIVNALRKMGVTVHVTSDIGKGFPDLVVSVRGRIWLIEIKNGMLSPSRQRLTDKEQEFHQLWKDHIKIINSVQKAIEFVNNA